MVTNFVMNWSLVGLMQERGLALSTSTVALANSALLYAIMRKRINGLEEKRTAIALLKILFASGVMGVVCWFANAWMTRLLGGSFSARLVSVGISVAVSTGVFYLGAYLLGIEELKAATTALTGRFKRRRG